MNLKSKRALSPVITTILLIMLAVVLAVTVLLWARGFMGESLSKFDEPIERACEQVNLIASLSGNQLSIINQGTVPVYKIGVSIVTDSKTEIIELEEINFLQGSSKIISDARLSSGVDKIIPILLGTGNSGVVKQYSCPKANWVSLE